jgi:hypothetical protein
MRRDQLSLAIEAATAITSQNSVIVIGSQSVLGTWSEEELPEATTLSNEVDMVPLADDDRQSLEWALNVYAGEDSEFHDLHGFYIEGVGRKTAVLPRGWEERLVVFPASKDSPKTGLCLDPHDLCVAKIIANRDKDRSFLGELVQAGLIRTSTLFDRLALTDISDVQMTIAQNFVGYLAETEPDFDVSFAPRVSESGDVQPYMRDGKPVRGYPKPSRH